MPTYRVMVDDNFHYQDKEQRYQHGVFKTAEAAIAACKAIVDADLKELLKPGMSAGELFDMYCMFGEDPFVQAEGAATPAVNFSAWDYAQEQVHVITATRSGPGLPEAEPSRR